MNELQSLSQIFQTRYSEYLTINEDMHGKANNFVIFGKT